MKNKIIPYNPKLKELAKKLRKQGILSEVVLWKRIKNKALGVEFHRQVPINNFIVDFYCHEIMLAIEVDGSSHDSADKQIKDSVRQNTLENLGVNFIRFKDTDVLKNTNEVIRLLQDKIADSENIPLSPLKGGRIRFEKFFILDQLKTYEHTR